MKTMKRYKNKWLNLPEVKLNETKFCFTVNFDTRVFISLTANLHLFQISHIKLYFIIQSCIDPLTQSWLLTGVRLHHFYKKH